MDMEYRNFGRTGVKVSPLCLGSMMFGGKAPEEDSFRMIDRALEAGINFIDTANVYAGMRSEDIVGRALERGGRRDRVVLATKAHFPVDRDDPNARGNSRRHLIRACEDSLRRLRTDHVDIFQIHRPQSDVPIDETLAALDLLVRQGKVRYTGTSTFAAWQCMEALMVARQRGFTPFSCEQPPYNLLDRRIERELIPFCQTYGIAIIPWSPLAGGLLTGAYSSANPAPEGKRFERDANEKKTARNNPVTLAVVDRFVAFAKERGVKPSQYALAWNMRQPGITSSIIGPRTMEQLEDNLAALAVEVTEQDREIIDRDIAPPGRMTTHYYQADFGPHRQAL